MYREGVFIFPVVYHCRNAYIIIHIFSAFAQLSGHIKWTTADLFPYMLNWLFKNTNKICWLLAQSLSLLAHRKQVMFNPLSWPPSPYPWTHSIHPTWLTRFMLFIPHQSQPASGPNSTAAAFPHLLEYHPEYHLGTTQSTTWVPSGYHLEYHLEYHPGYHLGTIWSTRCSYSTFFLRLLLLCWKFLAGRIYI